MKKIRIHRAWVIMVSLCLIMAGSYGLSINCIGVLFNAVLEDLGFSKGEMTLYYTVRGISSALAVGWTVNRFQTQKGHLWMAFYGALMAVSIGVMSSYTDLWHWYVSAAAAGVAMSGIYVIIPIVINNWFLRYRGSVLGLTFASSGFASMFLSPMVSKLIISFGWRRASLIMMAMGLLLMVPSSAFLLRKSPSELGLEPYGEALARQAPAHTLAWHDAEAPKSIFYMLLTFVLMGSLSMSFNNIITFFGQSLGYGLTASAMLTSFSMAGNLSGKIGAGILIDRIGPFKTGMIVSSLIGMAGLLFLFGQAYQPVIFTASLLYGFTYCSMTVQSPLALSIYGPKTYKAVLVKFTTISGLVNAGFSSAASFMYDYFNSFNPTLLCVVLSCVVQLIMLFVIQSHICRSKRNAV